MPIVVLGFYKRKKGITRQQFFEHWEKVHGPGILEIPNIERCLVRYVQHHLTPDSHYPTPDGMEFDGFSEGWFADENSRDQLYALEEFKSILLDEQEFLDMEATRWVVFDKQNVVISGEGVVKS